MPSLEVNGIRLNYRLDGDEGRPVLVMSNSLGTALEMWDPQVPALSEHFRILRYDKRGHGRSEVPPGPYSFEMLAGDVLVLMDGLGIERASFCGLSMGGMTGQWLGANAGARFDSLVLANTSSHMGPAAPWDERIAAVHAHGMAALVDAVIERWFTEDFRQAKPDVIARIRDMLLATDPEGYAGCCAAIRDMDHRPLLPRIAAPVLVIAGRHDPATPVAHAEYLSDNIPGARLHVIEDAAHLSNVQKPQAFTQALAGFLTGV